MRWKTMLALLCAFLTLAQGCLAFSDTVATLDQADALTLTVGGLEIRQITGTENGQQVLNAFLSPLSAQVAVNADAAYLAILSAGQEAASVQLGPDLWPDTKTLPHMLLNRFFSETLPALFDACMPAEEPPEPELRNVNVRNLPRSTQRTTLTVTPAQLVASPAVAQIRECAAQLSAHLAQADEITAWAENLEAVSNLTVKRLENDAGEPVAWNVTGNISSGGKDVRKMTLYGGMDGMNAYVSLKLPARSGKNNFELVIDLKAKTGKKKNTWAGTISFKRVMNGVSCTITDTVDLENEHTSGEQISGSVKRQLTEGGIKTVWTVKPVLASDGHGFQGTLKVTKKHAQTQVWELAVALSVREGAEAGTATAEGLSEFAAQLAEYLADYRSKLEPGDQRQLDHMLRTDAWMNGPLQ